MAGSNSTSCWGNLIMFNLTKRIVARCLFLKKWRKNNKDNYIVPKNTFPINLVEVGKYSYGPLNIRTWGASNEKLKIGNFVSIAEDVLFILGGNHRMDTLSTYPFKVMFLGEKREAYSKGPVVVEDDVWIGTRAIILSGVTIGKGAVIGAGAVVSKDIPPYAIAVGNPCKVLKYRFDEDVVQKLLKIDFGNINYSWIKKNKNHLTNVIDTVFLDSVIKEQKNVD